MKLKQYKRHRMAERVDEAKTVCATRWLSELIKLKQYKHHRMAERDDEAQTVHVSQDG